MTFSEKVLKLRIDKGLSQNELAKKAGLSQTAIYYLEKGKRQAKFETIIKIAAALDADFLELIDDNDTTLLYMKRSRDNRDIETYGQIKKRNFNESIEAFSEIQNDIENQIRSLYYSLSDSDMNTWLQSLEKYYLLLNDTGKAKANTEIKHAVEQIELLTKIPEFQKQPYAPPQK